MSLRKGSLNQTPVQKESKKSKKRKIDHFLLEIEADPKRTNLLAIKNNLREPLDLPLILERIIQSEIPIQSIQEVILTALLFGIEIDMPKKYTFIDHLMKFECPNIQINDADITFLFEGRVTKDTKGEWKSFNLETLQSFWRLLPEVLYNHENGKLFPQIASLVKRLVELLRCQIVWGRVVASFALFNLSIGIAALQIDEERIVNFKKTTIHLSLKTLQINLEARNRELIGFMVKYLVGLYEPLCDEFHNNTKFITVLRFAFRSRFNDLAIQLLEKVSKSLKAFHQQKRNMDKELLATHEQFKLDILEISTCIKQEALSLAALKLMNDNWKIWRYEKWPEGILHNLMHPSFEVRKHSLLFIDRYYFKQKFFKLNAGDYEGKRSTRAEEIDELVVAFFQKIDGVYQELMSSIVIELKAFVKPKDEKAQEEEIKFKTPALHSRDTIHHLERSLRLSNFSLLAYDIFGGEEEGEKNTTQGIKQSGIEEIEDSDDEKQWEDVEEEEEKGMFNNMLKVIENKEATYLLNLTTNPLKSYDSYERMATKLAQNIYEFSPIFQNLESLIDVLIPEFEKQPRSMILLIKIIEENGRHFENTPSKFWDGKLWKQLIQPNYNQYVLLTALSSLMRLMLLERKAKGAEIPETERIIIPEDFATILLELYQVKLKEVIRQESPQEESETPFFPQNLDLDPDHKLLDTILGLFKVLTPFLDDQVAADLNKEIINLNTKIGRVIMHELHDPESQRIVIYKTAAVVSRNWNYHALFFPESGTVLLEEMIKLTLIRIKSGLLNYNPFCAYVYELLPRLLKIYRSQINHLMRERENSEDQSTRQSLINEELRLQENEADLAVEMANTLESCFVLKSRDKPQWLGECEFAAMESFLGILGFILNDVQTLLPTYSFKDINPFLNRTVQKLEQIMITQLSKPILEFSEEEIDVEPLCMNQFQQLVTSCSSVLRNRIYRIFPRIITILTHSLKLFYMKPTLCVDFLAKPLNFQNPELSAVYMRALVATIINLKKLRNFDPQENMNEFTDVPFTFVIQKAIVQIMEANLRDVDVQFINRGFISIPSYDLTDKTKMYNLMQIIVFFRALRSALVQNPFQFEELQKLLSETLPNLLTYKEHYFILMTAYDLLADPRILGSALVAIFVKSITEVLKGNQQFVSERNEKRLILYIKSMTARIKKYHEIIEKKAAKKREGDQNSPKKRGKSKASLQKRKDSSQGEFTLFDPDSEKYKIESERPSQNSERNRAGGGSKSIGMKRNKKDQERNEVKKEEMKKKGSVMKGKQRNQVYPTTEEMLDELFS